MPRIILQGENTHLLYDTIDEGNNQFFGFGDSWMQGNLTPRFMWGFFLGCASLVTDLAGFVLPLPKQNTMSNIATTEGNGSGAVKRLLGFSGSATGDQQVFRDKYSDPALGFSLPFPGIQEVFLGTGVTANSSPVFRYTINHSEWANIAWDAPWDGAAGDKIITRAFMLGAPDMDADMPDNVYMTFSTSRINGENYALANSRALWQNGKNPNLGEYEAPVARELFAIDRIDDTPDPLANRNLSIFTETDTPEDNIFLNLAGVGVFKAAGPTDKHVAATGTVFNFMCGVSSASFDALSTEPADHYADNTKQFPVGSYGRFVDLCLTNMDQRPVFFIHYATENKTQAAMETILRAGITRIKDEINKIPLTRPPLFVLVGPYRHEVTGRTYSESLTNCQDTTDAMLAVAQDNPNDVVAIDLLRTLNSYMLDDDTGTGDSGNQAAWQAWLGARGYDTWIRSDGVTSVDLTADNSLVDDQLHAHDEQAAEFFYGEVMLDRGNAGNTPRRRMYRAIKAATAQAIVETFGKNAFAGPVGVFSDMLAEGGVTYFDTHKADTITEAEKVAARASVVALFGTVDGLVLPPGKTLDAVAEAYVGCVSAAVAGFNVSKGEEIVAGE